MNHRQKVEALRNEINAAYDVVDTTGAQFNQGQKAVARRTVKRLDAILADWPEEPTKKDLQAVAEECARAACDHTFAYQMVPAILQVLKEKM